METTNEIKVIAQYIGQKVKVTSEKYIDCGYIGTILGVCSVRGLLVEHPKVGDGYEKIEDCKLILRELTNIKDEHAIEACKILGCDWHMDLNEVTLESKRFSIEKIFSFNQYLISKGCDLPHFLLGGKTLFELGLSIKQEYHD